MANPTSKISKNSAIERANRAISTGNSLRAIGVESEARSYYRSAIDLLTRAGLTTEANDVRRSVGVTA
jgi:hypothetical protein